MVASISWALSKLRRYKKSFDEAREKNLCEASPFLLNTSLEIPSATKKKNLHVGWFSDVTQEEFKICSEKKHVGEKRVKDTWEIRENSLSSSERAPKTEELSSSSQVSTFHYQFKSILKFLHVRLRKDFTLFQLDMNVENEKLSTTVEQSIIYRKDSIKPTSFLVNRKPNNGDSVRCFLSNVFDGEENVEDWWEAQRVKYFWAIMFLSLT